MGLAALVTLAAAGIMVGIRRPPGDQDKPETVRFKLNQLYEAGL